MRDFRIVSSRIILPIFGVAPIRGFLPPSIVAVGDNMGEVNEVEYNGVLVQEFIATAQNRLVIRIPPSQLGKSLKLLRAYSPASRITGDALISLNLTKPSRTIAGVDRLVQSFMMVFMSTPGSDLFDPDSAGGGLSIIGRSVDGGGKAAAADLALAVERTKTVLMASQSKQPNLPLSETLLSCTLDSVEFDKSTTSLNARVVLQNRLGESAEVTVR